MRTTDEIIERYKSVLAEAMPFDFRAEVLLSCVPRDRLLELVPTAQETLSEEDWANWDAEATLTHDAVFDAAQKYLVEYGFEKAVNHRGLSAGRSVQKLGEWLWILHFPTDDFEAADYQNYGAPQLRVAARLLDVEFPMGGALERMSEGLPCTPADEEKYGHFGCQEGCSS